MVAVMKQGSGGQRGDTQAGNDLFSRDAADAGAERRHADRAADLPAAFSTAEAVPELARSTLDKMAVVIAGTASPIPAGMRMKPGSISMKVARTPNRKSRAYPTAPMSPPRTIGRREPVRPAIQPLAMFEAMKVPVRGRKARPA